MAAKIGVISDTHGLLREEAIAALAGVDHIVHAGDIGDGVLDRLRAIAPVTAVRGNNDVGSPLPETARLRLDGRVLFVIHDRKELREGLDGIDVVISGHSHEPAVERRGGVLYLNPGSAGPRRFRLPVALAILDLADLSVDPIVLVRPPPR